MQIPMDKMLWIVGQRGRIFGRQAKSSSTIHSNKFLAALNTIICFIALKMPKV